MKAYRMDYVSVAMIGGYIEEYLVTANDEEDAWQQLADYKDEHIDDAKENRESYHMLGETDLPVVEKRGVYLMREYEV